MARIETKHAVNYYKQHDNGAIRASWYLTLAIDENAAKLNCLSAHPTATIIRVEQFKMPIAAARLFYHSYNVPQVATK